MLLTVVFCVLIIQIKTKSIEKVSVVNQRFEFKLVQTFISVGQMSLDPCTWPNGGWPSVGQMGAGKVSRIRLRYICP